MHEVLHNAVVLETKPTQIKVNVLIPFHFLSAFAPVLTPRLALLALKFLLYSYGSLGIANKFQLNSSKRFKLGPEEKMSLCYLTSI